jgi:PD-(D/E)XK nuclease superfamily
LGKDAEGKMPTIADDMGLYEALMMPAYENVHTASIGWLLSDASRICLRRRIEIIQSLFIGGTPDFGCEDIIEIGVATEWNKIDLLLTLQSAAGPIFVAIENKIKARQGEKQLEKYWDELERYNNELAPQQGATHYAFLTLSNDEPFDTRWHQVNYNDLDNAFGNLKGDAAQVGAVCTAVKKLANLRNDALGGNGAAIYFGEEQGGEIENPVDFAQVGGLTQAAQSAWLNELGYRLRENCPSLIRVHTDWSSKSSGVFLNLEAPHPNDCGVIVGLQIEKRKVKVFMRPALYKDRSNDNKVVLGEQISACDHLFVALHQHFGTDLVSKVTCHKGRGFRSLILNVAIPRGRDLDGWRNALVPTAEILENFIQEQNEEIG